MTVRQKMSVTCISAFDLSVQGVSTLRDDHGPGISLRGVATLRDANVERESRALRHVPVVSLGRAIGS
jgi:hypothetical protein